VFFIYLEYETGSVQFIYLKRHLYEISFKSPSQRSIRYLVAPQQKSLTDR